MKKGISIHLGVNRPGAFPQSELTHCEDDANAMYQLAGTAGFTASRLLGSDATFDQVVAEIQKAADNLNPGDTFLFTFAGHGFRDHVTVDTINEPDGINESIALADRFLLDDFWRGDLWPRFQAGVRAITIPDCCHSGGVLFILNLLHEALSATGTELGSPGLHLDTVSRFLARTSASLYLRKSSRGGRMFFTQPFSEPTIGDLILRVIPERLAQKELNDHKSFYDEQRIPPTKPIVVERLFLAACGEREDAVEGEHHGAFTQALLDVWNGGNFVGNYRDFMNQIQSSFTNTNQHPVIGPVPLPAFSSEHPFTI